MFFVLTEEYPALEEIAAMLQQVGHTVPDSVTNNHIVPTIVQTEKGSQFKGEWTLTVSPTLQVRIKLYKGHTACVDYMLFDDDASFATGDASSARVILESTKTSDDGSRNTSVFQRITKFTTFRKMYPDANPIQVMYWGNANWKDAITPTAHMGLQLMATLGIELISHAHTHIHDIHHIHERFVNIKEKYNILPFASCDELIETKNNIKQKKGNESIRLRKEEQTIYLSLKLDKGSGAQKGIVSHDPNVGFLCATLHCLEKLAHAPQQYVIENHGIAQAYFDKGPKSKMWHSIGGFRVTFQDCTIKETPPLPPRYFTIESKMTEKLATILCDITSPHTTIFSNHGGCALTSIQGGGQTEDSVGRKMPRPDIVFQNKEKKEICIIEGKVEKDLSKGLQQLADAHLEGFMGKIRALYPDHTITKGLCITISDIAAVENYSRLEFPIMFALDEQGYFVDRR